MERNAINLISFGMLMVSSILYFLSSFIIPQDYVFWKAGIQLFAIVSGAFLLLYNGKRGYNAKWFQYGSYLYYPIHLGIIFLIGMLITLLS